VTKPVCIYPFTAILGSAPSHLPADKYGEDIGESEMDGFESKDERNINPPVCSEVPAQSETGESSLLPMRWLSRAASSASSVGSNNSLGGGMGNLPTYASPNTRFPVEVIMNHKGQEQGKSKKPHLKTWHVSQSFSFLLPLYTHSFRGTSFTS